MNPIKLILRLSAAMVMLQGTVLAGGDGWLTDVEAAKKLAAESNKDILMDFTGSDWCVWCQRLNEEVFSKEAFKAGVKGEFVLLEVDFPKDTSKIPEATQKQNKELQDKYKPQGFPTLVLTDAEGRPYAVTGYQPGGAEPYLTHLKKLREAKAKRDAAIKTAASSEGPAKARALMAGLDAMGLPDAMVASFYGDWAPQIQAADPKDESGFAKKQAAKERAKEMDKKVRGFMAKRDFAGAHGVVNDSLKEAGIAPEESLMLLMTRAQLFATEGKFDDALKAIDDAKAASPQSPFMAQIDAFRKRVEDGKKKQAAEGTAAPKDDSSPKPTPNTH